MNRELIQRNEDEEIETERRKKEEERLLKIIRFCPVIRGDCKKKECVFYRIWHGERLIHNSKHIAIKLRIKHSYEECVFKV